MNRLATLKGPPIRTRRTRVLRDVFAGGMHLEVGPPHLQALQHGVELGDGQLMHRRLGAELDGGRDAVGLRIHCGSERGVQHLRLFLHGNCLTRWLASALVLLCGRLGVLGLPARPPHTHRSAD